MLKTNMDVRDSRIRSQDFSNIREAVKSQQDWTSFSRKLFRRETNNTQPNKTVKSIKFNKQEIEKKI